MGKSAGISRPSKQTGSSRIVRCRAGFILAAVLLFIGRPAFAGGGPEAVEYPLDYEISKSVMGEKTLVVAYRDPVVLTDDSRWIESLGNTGYFYLRARFLFQTVVVSGRPGETGNPDIRLWINGIRRRYPENHRKLVGDMIEGAAVDYGLGAAAVIGRVYNEDGMDAVYAMLRRIKDRDVRRTLIEDFVLEKNYGIDDSFTMLDLVFPSVGDQEKSEMIVAYAEKLPSSDEVTVKLLEAAGRIVSSERKYRTVVSVAALRGLTGQSARVAFVAIRGIPSSDDKSAALVDMLGILYNGSLLDVTVEDYLDVCATIPSSDDKVRVLTELLRVKHSLTSVELRRFLRVTRSIPSSDGKRDVFLNLIHAGYIDASTITDFLDTAVSIPSSDDKRDVLIAVVSIMRTDDSLKSRYVVGELLNTARTISSSSDKTAVILALIRLEGLDRKTLTDIAEFTAKNIHSSDDRERILKELIG